MSAEARLQELGLVLPPPMVAPPGLQIPFRWVRRHGDRVFVSGHGARDDDGKPAGPFGKVPSTVSLEEAQDYARRTTIAILGTLRDELGSLDRVKAWLTVTGFVNAEPGFATTPVLNPCSQLLLDVFGPEVGAHARTAIGASALPLDVPVVIAAEIAVD